MIGYSLSTMTNNERMQRESSLIDFGVLGPIRSGNFLDLSKNEKGGGG